MASDTEVFDNTYEHCDTTWVMTGDSMHNDRCPVCRKEIEPVESLELSSGEIIEH